MSVRRIDPRVFEQTCIHIAVLACASHAMSHTSVLSLLPSHTSLCASALDRIMIYVLAAISGSSIDRSRQKPETSTGQMAEGMSQSELADIRAWASREAGMLDTPTTAATDKDKGSPSVETPTENKSSDIDVFSDVKEFEKHAADIARKKQEEDATQAQTMLNKKDIILQKAVEAGEYDISSALGQKFSRSAEAKTDAYKKLQTHEQKQAFRQEWARTKYAEVLEKKVYARTHKMVRTERGRYLSFKKICEEEGEDEDGGHGGEAVRLEVPFNGPSFHQVASMDATRPVLVHHARACGALRRVVGLDASERLWW